MLGVTEKVGKYISSLGIKISVLSRDTGISRNILDACFSESGTRVLRADEFLLICSFLDLDPREFGKEESKEGGE